MTRKTAITSSLCLAMCVVALVGCRIHVRGEATVPAGRITVVNDPPATQPPPPTAPVPVPASAPELVAGVTTDEGGCTPGAPEQLNGIDDNCNGQVDEGFVQSGDVQITLHWATGADMDLYVTDPFNEVLSFSNTSSNSGGSLDRDARGTCTDGQTGENVYWPAGQAPRGTYQVEVHYFHNCNVAGPTPVTLSIMVGGRALGVYQYTLSSDDRIRLATFTIP